MNGENVNQTKSISSTRLEICVFAALKLGILPRESIGVNSPF